MTARKTSQTPVAVPRGTGMADPAPRRDAATLAGEAPATVGVFPASPEASGPGRESPVRDPEFQARRWRIELPAGMELLNANDRAGHWARRKRLTSALREATAWLARQQRIPQLAHAHVLGFYEPPDRRRRDPANWQPSFKACVDGLTDAGVFPDDDAEHVDGPDPRLGPVCPRGRVVLVITELGAENMTALTAVSLFAGIGGIDRALEAAGIRVTTAVEIDPTARGVLGLRFPQVRLRNDVTEVTGDDLIADGFVPGRGILAAGWPCTGNSVAGRRGGLGDPRSGLWRHVVRLLAETRPLWFLGENVPGLYSVNGGADIAVVRSDLAQLGYWWTERNLDAQYSGVPQRRSRVFFVGCAGDRAAPVEVLLEPEGRERHTAARRAARKGAASHAPGRAGDARTLGTIGGSGPGGGWRVGSDEAAAGQLVTAPLTTRPYADNAAQESSLIAATLQGGGRRGHRIDAEGAAGGHLIPFDTVQITHGENRSNPQPGDPSPTLNGNGLVHVAGSPLPFRVGETSAAITAHHGKGPDSDATNGLILDCAIGSLALPRGDRVSDLGEGKGADSDATSGLVIAHALTSEGSDASEDGTGAYGTSGVPRPVPSSLAVRRLTPLETERLQGLPDEWTRWRLEDGKVVEQSDSARYRQVGNSVAVPVVEWITRRIAAVDASRELPADECGAA